MQSAGILAYTIHGVNDVACRGLRSSVDVTLGRVAPWNGEQQPFTAKSGSSALHWRRLNMIRTYRRTRAPAIQVIRVIFEWARPSGAPRVAPSCRVLRVTTMESVPCRAQGGRHGWGTPSRLSLSLLALRHTTMTVSAIPAQTP